jgi:hypothetical protein
VVCTPSIEHGKNNGFAVRLAGEPLFLCGKIMGMATADQLVTIGQEFAGLMDEAPSNMYVVERHHLGLTA